MSSARDPDLAESPATDTKRRSRRARRAASSEVEDPTHDLDGGVTDRDGIDPDADLESEHPTRVSAMKPARTEAQPEGPIAAPSHEASVVGAVDAAEHRGGDTQAAVATDADTSAAPDAGEASEAAPPDTFQMQRRKAVIAVIVGAIVIAFLGWLLGSQIESPSDVAARAQAPTPSPILVPVKEQQLSTVVRARGTGGFGSPRPVQLPASNLGAGTIVTSLPTAGAVVQEGGVLATLSGRPVFALQGDAPMYRDLGPGMSGTDVAQLETALQRIGINPGAVDGLYDAGTEAAVRTLYVNAGFQPVTATLAQLEGVRAAQCGVDATSCPGAGVQVPANEVFFVAGTPVQVGDVTGTVGAEASGPLMTVSDSTPKVIGGLNIQDAKLVKPGMTVDIDEPDLGINTSGKVTVVADGPGTQGQDQFHVYFETSVKRPPSSLNKASVRVTIPIKTTKGKQLTVPASAVILDSDGSSRVQVLRKDGVQDVTVRPGLSASGLVAIKPLHTGEIKPGDQVVVGFDQRGG